MEYKLIRDMFYTREILSKLEKELLTKEIIVLTGMRQIGKTTLLKHLFSLVASQNKAIFDLENPLQRKIFEAENYDAIWQGLAEYGLKNTERAFIFIDEMQNLPEISKVVKYLYDHYQVKFFLTGSSSFYLRNLFPESMAGRKIIFELFPLTFSEFLVFKGVSREEAFDFEDKAKKKNRIAYELYLPFYQEFMDYGGCPAVVLEKDYARKKELMQEIFTSYFEKDVRN
ncbi:MAG: ATPase, partial [candidate division CPR1 bacterium GW2011_GWA2_42_17]